MCNNPLFLVFFCVGIEIYKQKTYLINLSYFFARFFANKCVKLSRGFISREASGP